ncbi:hypothetical protein SVAN01_10718 [Stagonosporopsis vannaccii]|nr:hypothetical protein SVAN01_10718 [Stagonosporopsis vannaccii]
MSPDSITTFVKMRAALNKALSQHTPFLISLIDNGKNYPHSCRPAVRLAFGRNERDFPGLGKKVSPFHSKLPSFEVLQGLLVNDLQAVKADEHDEEPKLLSYLINGNPVTSDAVFGFPSPSLIDICGDAKVEYDNVLQESMAIATVLPAATLLSLQHSNEGTTFTSLLSGSVVWIRSDRTKMDICDQLHGGVCLVQSTGRTLRIPPFCSMVCLSLEASIFATYSVVTADQLADMMGKLPLLLAWLKTEIDGERKKMEFVTALLLHLSAILQGSFEKTDLMKCRYPYSEEGPLYSLLHNWDEIRSAVAGILDRSQAEQMIVMWDMFLRNSRGRQCWLCETDIKNKSKEMRKHFETQHWWTEKSTDNVGNEQELEPQLRPRLQRGRGKGRSINDSRSGQRREDFAAPPVLEEADAGIVMENNEGIETSLHIC